MIFPRYHQLEAVRMLVGAAHGRRSVGHNYLVEHSAGSGKSNTIGWLSHRLASLHDATDERVFDSVIVVTDRVVLESATPGHDLPVRAQARRRAADRRKLATTRRSARKCGAGDHYHASEIPLCLAAVAQDGRGARYGPGRERSRPGAAPSSSTRPTAPRAVRRQPISRKCWAAKRLQARSR